MHFTTIITLLAFSLLNPVVGGPIEARSGDLCVPEGWMRCRGVNEIQICSNVNGITRWTHGAWCLHGYICSDIVPGDPECKLLWQPCLPPHCKSAEVDADKVAIEGPDSVPEVKEGEEVNAELATASTPTPTSTPTSRDIAQPTNPGACTGFEQYQMRCRDLHSIESCDLIPDHGTFEWEFLAQCPPKSICVEQYEGVPRCRPYTLPKCWPICGAAEIAAARKEVISEGLPESDADADVVLEKMYGETSAASTEILPASSTTNPTPVVEDTVPTKTRLVPRETDSCFPWQEFELRCDGLREVQMCDKIRKDPDRFLWQKFRECAPQTICVEIAPGDPRCRLYYLPNCWPVCGWSQLAAAKEELIESGLAGSEAEADTMLEDSKKVFAASINQGD